MQFIDLQRQYAAYRHEIDARMRTVIEHAQFIMGPEIEELEGALAGRIGVAHAITTASGTASLEMSLRALEIGPGDEVITPSFTFVAAAEITRLVGATPVFVDIDDSSFNIDPAGVESAITTRTKAIVTVNLFGQMADYRRLNEIAGKHQLTVVEDAAQSLGATQDGQASGGASEIGSTSFFPTKTLACFGDGGALFTNNEELADRFRELRTHGGEGFDHRRVGTNARFDTIQAAVLLARTSTLNSRPDGGSRLVTRTRLATSAGFRRSRPETRTSSRPTPFALPRATVYTNSYARVACRRRSTTRAACTSSRRTPTSLHPAISLSPSELRGKCSVCLFIRS